MKRVAFVMTVLGVLGLAAPAFTEELPAMTIWKSPWCGCCGKWVEHMRAAGFEVQVNEVEDLSVVKRMAAVPNDLESCHTARVGAAGRTRSRCTGYAVWIARHGERRARPLRRFIAKARW
jgi:hypothetical protein